MGAATLTPTELPAGGTLEEVDLDAQVPCHAPQLARTFGVSGFIASGAGCDEPAEYRYVPPCGHGINICAVHADVARVMRKACQLMCNLGAAPCGDCQQCQVTACSGASEVRTLG